MVAKVGFRVCHDLLSSKEASYTEFKKKLTTRILTKNRMCGGQSSNFFRVCHDLLSSKQESYTALKKMKYKNIY